MSTRAIRPIEPQDAYRGVPSKLTPNTVNMLLQGERESLIFVSVEQEKVHGVLSLLISKSLHTGDNLLILQELHATSQEVKDDLNKYAQCFADKRRCKLISLNYE